MSADEYVRLKEWFLKNHEVEAVFVDEINKNVSTLFQEFGFPRLTVGEIQNLLVQITKRKETEYPEFAVNSPATTLFLGGMAKAISDIILTELLPKMMPETKKCKNCNASNNKVVNYCFQCGTKFEDN